ncbi:alkaline phosphatase family protein [Catenovulum sp. SM1970]|uniref:alkaline phosphatase family protein n=1 Tax=Marinifaba aquimaris TaxID=2741323 RepID=UPI0015741F27|nr:alkaline phosphatase family protein [Marinifaba aquimaris]NTS78136.1 alkaline phosphatase family protein [Marinifaba aquimaris]
MKIVYLLLTSLLFVSINLHAKDRKLVLITIDGLRWQEVFNGADLAMAHNRNISPHLQQAQLLKGDESQRRQALMPFLWQTIAEQGVLIGDRNQDSTMQVQNQWAFSYPGYSEIFTGVTNPKLDSNAKRYNPEISFLEWLNHQPKYQNKIGFFGSWDVFPYILNQPRSQLHINAGFASASHQPQSAQITLLNQLQSEIPSPWHNVRLDSFTYRFAKDYLLNIKPEVLTIAFGETDDFAHDGRYDLYLEAALRTDQYIADLWQQLQQMPEYKNNTNLLIVTDHGRGNTLKDWQHHASNQAVQRYMKALKKDFANGVVGAEHIWMAAIGPDIKNIGLLKAEKDFYQSQIASTALTLLKQDPITFNPKANNAISEIIK